VLVHGPLKTAWPAPSEPCGNAVCSCGEHARAMRLTRRGWALPAGVWRLAAALLLACCAGERARAQFVGIDFNSPARLVFGATQLAEALLDQSVSKVVIHGAPQLCPTAAASPPACARRAWLHIGATPVQCTCRGVRVAAAAAAASAAA